jgi:hypothetical protein
MTTPTYVELAEELAAHDQQDAEYLAERAESRAKLVEDLNKASAAAPSVLGMTSPAAGQNGHPTSKPKSGPGRKPGSKNKPKEGNGKGASGPELALGIIRKHRKGATTAQVVKEMIQLWRDKVWQPRIDAEEGKEEGRLGANVSQILNGLRKKELTTMERDEETKKNLHTVVA